MTDLRHKNSLLTIRAQDLKSMTSVKTRVNTSRNKRTASSSSNDSEASSGSFKLSEEVEECDCCGKSGRQGRKVRFAHPSVTKVVGENVIFSTPLSNIALMSEEDRQRSREKGKLHGTAYQGMNAGPICKNAPAKWHYKGICDCYRKAVDKEEEEGGEEQEGAQFTFKYTGPLYDEEELQAPKLRRKGSKITRVLGLATAEEEAEWEDIMERSHS